MHILALAAGAFALQLTPEHIAEWNNLKTLSSSVADKDCSGEIVSIIEKSSEIYGRAGLSQEFVQSLENIKIVAGDIPEAEGFRNQLGNITGSFSDYFKQQTEILKSIEEAQKTTSVAEHAYPTTTSAEAQPTDDEYEVSAQSFGTGRDAAYGVLSSAKQAGYALTGLGMLAALFL